MTYPVLRLGHVASIKTSNVDKKSYDGEVVVRLCNYTDVYKNDTITSEMDFMVATATQDQVGKFGLKVGDTVFTKDSETADDIGIPAYVVDSAHDLVCGYHLAIARPLEGATDPRFLYWCLAGPEAAQQWSVLAAGVTRVGLRQADIGKLEIPVPPIKTQRKVASFLDRETAQIDKLIRKQERLIELLAEKRQATITHAVTKGLDPSAPTKPSGVPWQGPVPEHWTVQPLKNLIRMQTGVTLGKDFSEVETETYPYLRVANVQIGYVDLNEVKEIDLPKDLAATSMLRAGDVLMTEGGDRDKLARGCIWEAQIAPCVHQNHIFAVRTGDQLLNKFLVLALDADPARAYFYLTGKQSTNLASTNSTTVKNFRFGVPPVVEQHRIVDQLGRKTRLIDDLVDKANAVISTLRERRSALISAAVTGKIDVREGVA
ncbi:restriction endonuclease subunit S [Pseudarthrobacter sp. B907]|uniref:restriction endonuclease subunit S n=1 Tax=Pseudarthrobacter sp. B907 TaxID=3158261 RepID=UPI0032DA3A2F